VLKAGLPYPVPLNLDLCNLGWRGSR
jgi:hypothetical protein